MIDRHFCCSHTCFSKMQVRMRRLVRRNMDTDIGAYPQSQLRKCFMRIEMHLLCFYKPQRCTQREFRWETLSMNRSVFDYKNATGLLELPVQQSMLETCKPEHTQYLSDSTDAIWGHLLFALSRSLAPSPPFIVHLRDRWGNSLRQKRRATKSVLSRPRHSCKYEQSDCTCQNTVYLCISFNFTCISFTSLPLDLMHFALWC